MNKLNNKGFVFIEMVVTVAILLTTLVLLYSSYSNVIITEKKRLYYDDISYVYRSNVLQKVLNKTLDTTLFISAILSLFCERTSLTSLTASSTSF